MTRDEEPLLAKQQTIKYKGWRSLSLRPPLQAFWKPPDCEQLAWIGCGFGGCPPDFRIMRILVKKGRFLIEMAGFWAENGAKTRVRSYYLINRAKSYIIDCLVFS
ncbi:MAG: hypothetical protein ABR907_14045 [Terracidiphilus sp.]